MTQITVEPTLPEEKPEPNKKFYLSVWRWHFYAGLFSIPFLIMLSITGLMMLIGPYIEEAQHSEKIYVEPQQQSIPISQQLINVEAEYGENSVNEFIPPLNSNRSSQFYVTDAEGNDLRVYVDPYTGAVLGDLNPSQSIEAIGNDIHGEFFMGKFGDGLIELAAGFTFLLIVTGLYMWWPRTANQKRHAFVPEKVSNSRGFYKSLHSTLGLYLSVILILFVFTGLSWSGIWGSQLVQGWNSFPAEKWNNVPLSDETHASLNRGAVEEVPWNLEQTLLPMSGSDAGIEGIPNGYEIDIDSINILAEAVGFTQYQIAIPKDLTAVYTISADTMSGDIKDARNDRTMHVDQYTGKILVDIGWDEYSLMAKSMAAGVALHQGDMGVWNLFLNIAFCLLIILMCVASLFAWWKRRPNNAKSLVAPPLPKNFSLWKGASILMIVCSIVVPLSAAVLLILLILDMLIFKRIKFFNQAIS